MKQNNIIQPGKPLAYTIIGITLVLLPLLMAGDFFFTPFMCRYVCTGKNPVLEVFSVTANLCIFVAYFGIPFAILKAVKQVPNIKMQAGPLAILFMLFIFLCGITHLLQALAWFQAYYILMAYVECLTAVVSLFTLWRLSFYITKAVLEEKKKREEVEAENRQLKVLIERYNIKLS